MSTPTPLLDEEQTQELIEQMFGKTEPLSPELVPYLETNGDLRILRHPLVTAIYHEVMNPQYNEMLVQGKARLKDALDREDWYDAIFVRERPYRLLAFMEVHGKLPSNVAGDLLTEVWKDAEWPHAARHVWLRLFTRYSRVSQIMIRSREHLPRVPFEVYRGADRREVNRTWPRGISWTLDRGRAEWFSKRLQTDGVVMRATISPHHAFAYLPERDEQEVVLDPRRLTTIRVDE